MVWAITGPGGLHAGITQGTESECESHKRPQAQVTPEDRGQSCAGVQRSGCEGKTSVSMVSFLEVIFRGGKFGTK